MIGKRLKELRIQKGLSQQDLGDAIGVTKVSICGYENGTRLPNLEKLVSLAEKLEVSERMIRQYKNELEEAGKYAEHMRQELYGEFAGNN